MTKKKFLICVDSDGTVMDTMRVKHSRCLGPALVKEWGLEAWKEEVLRIWYDINLYQITRGIVRFQALAIALRRINEKITPVQGVGVFENWVKSEPSLSVKTLEEKRSEDPVFEKVWQWNQEVNRLVAGLPVEERKIFPGAMEGIQIASEFGDVAVISTANREALTEEWERAEVIEYTNYVMAQDSGSKKQCIAALLEMGYAPENTLMIGDAPSDLQAAKANGVFFYPILAGKETASWQQLVSQGFRALAGDRYAEYEKDRIHSFYEHLGVKEI